MPQRAARAGAPGDTSAARRMCTAPGSPSSGAAACASRNLHSASCSSVAPPPAASSARPAAPCASRQRGSSWRERGARCAVFTWSCA
jgi:hypothetical protein